ncbi:hypothetical protein ACSQ67_001367 [Phaseolus vulgaris]
MSQDSSCQEGYNNECCCLSRSNDPNCPPLSSAAAIIAVGRHRQHNLFVTGTTPCLLHKARRTSLSLFQSLFLQFQLWLRGSYLLSYSVSITVCHVLQ